MKNKLYALFFIMILINSSNVLASSTPKASKPSNSSSAAQAAAKEKDQANANALASAPAQQPSQSASSSSAAQAAAKQASANAVAAQLANRAAQDKKKAAVSDFFGMCVSLYSVRSSEEASIYLNFGATAKKKEISDTFTKNQKFFVTKVKEQTRRYAEHDNLLYYVKPKTAIIQFLNDIHNPLAGTVATFKIDLSEVSLIQRRQKQVFRGGFGTTLSFLTQNKMPVAKELLQQHLGIPLN